METLFGNDWGQDESQVDDTQITTTLLYYSIDELKEFKALCKKGLKKEHPEEYQEKGNIPDLLLKVLRQKYGNN